MSPTPRRHLLFWSVAAAGTLADLVSKVVVSANYPEGGVAVSPLVPGILGIRRHRNFGALGGVGSGYPVLLVVVSFLAMGVIVWLFLTARPAGRLTDTALGLMMAGAAGNLIDRLYFGYVRDFLKFIFWERYPVFNLADACLTGGVILMLGAVLFSRRGGREEADRDARPARTGGG